MIAEAKLDELMMVPSERRAEVLARLCAESDVDEARELLAGHFNICDALAPWATELRAQFERVEFVTDEESTVPALPVIVYRAAWEDDNVDNALSWTTDLEFAKRFCKGLTGPRAKLILNTYRDDVDAVIFQGICVKAFGWLNSREESEIVADEVVEIMPILRLETVKA